MPQPPTPVDFDPTVAANLPLSLDQAPARPTLRWLFSHPAHFIALGAGSGLSPIAPGTCGSLLGWVSFAWLAPRVSETVWLAVIGVGLIVGAWTADIAGRHLGVGQRDSGHIVIDEIVAFWLVLVMLPGTTWSQQAIAFVLFRVFDMTKPPPIARLDARFKNGIGVMLDDLAAAFYTLLVIAVWLRLAT